MWVIKFHGQTLYINHVECNVPWSTKETPDNNHTKGSIKIKNCLLQINDCNEATISRLTLVDKIRLKNQKLGITRIIISEKKFGLTTLKKLIKENDIKHGPIKSIGGACTTTFYITDIYDKEDVTYLALMLTGTDFRQLMPNEAYYKWYDDPRGSKIFIDEDFDDDYED